MLLGLSAYSEFLLDTAVSAEMASDHDQSTDARVWPPPELSGSKPSGLRNGANVELERKIAPWPCNLMHPKKRLKLSIKLTLPLKKSRLCLQAQGLLYLTALFMPPPPPLPPPPLPLPSLFHESFSLFSFTYYLSTRYSLSNYFIYSAWSRFHHSLFKSYLVKSIATKREYWFCILCIFLAEQKINRQAE